MQLTQSQSLRFEQRQLLTPRMIQSMEILQLPMLALEERIEQELQNNPVLEQRETDPDDPAAIAASENGSEKETAEEQALVVKDDASSTDDFERLARISEYLENEEFSTNSSANFRRTTSEDGERDRRF